MRERVAGRLGLAAYLREIYVETAFLGDPRGVVGGQLDDTVA
jgi:hypothetical protein